MWWIQNRWTLRWYRLKTQQLLLSLYERFLVCNPNSISANSLKYTAIFLHHMLQYYTYSSIVTIFCYWAILSHTYSNDMFRRTTLFYYSV
jgi:hypothetical protein